MCFYCTYYLYIEVKQLKYFLYICITIINIIIYALKYYIGSRWNNIWTHRHIYNVHCTLTRCTRSVQTSAWKDNIWIIMTWLYGDMDRKSHMRIQWGILLSRYTPYFHRFRNKIVISIFIHLSRPQWKMFYRNVHVFALWIINSIPTYIIYDNKMIIYLFFLLE